MLIGALAPGLSWAVTAGAFDITPGTGWTYASNVLTINAGGSYTIAMATPGATTTTDRIVVASGVTADITLSGVDIELGAAATGPAFDMTGATVNLTLTGTSTLKSGTGCPCAVPESPGRF